MRRGQLMRWGCASVWLALAAGGCSNGNDAGAGGYATAGSLAQGLAQAFCDWQARCCTPPEIQLLDGTSAGAGAADGGASSCGALALLSASEQLAPLTVAVNQGLVTIDPTAAAACVAAYRNRPCNLPPINPQAPAQTTSISAEPLIDDALAACPGLFIGAVPLGARCDMSLECMPGARCFKQGLLDEANQLAYSTFLGVCFPNQPAGGPCTTSADCDPAAHLYCRGTDLTCAAPAGDGEPCLSSFGELIQCDANQHLACDPTTQVCRHLPVDTEPCVSPVSVETMPICDPDPGLALTCVGATIGGGGGICHKLGAAGDACGVADLPRCSVDLACTNLSATGVGTCGAAPSVGEPCAVDGACASPGVCGSDGVCATPGGAPSGALCPNGDADCLSRLCAPDPTFPPTCAPPMKWNVRCAGTAVTGASFLHLPGSPPI